MSATRRRQLMDIAGAMVAQSAGRLELVFGEPTTASNRSTPSDIFLLALDGRRLGLDIKYYFPTVNTAEYWALSVLNILDELVIPIHDAGLSAAWRSRRREVEGPSARISSTTRCIACSSAVSRSSDGNLSKQPQENYS